MYHYVIFLSHLFTCFLLVCLPFLVICSIWLSLLKGNEGKLTFSDQHIQEGLVPFVVDAVYTMAYALEHMHQDKCRYEVTVCQAMHPVAGAELLHYIRNVSFIG